MRAVPFTPYGKRDLMIRRLSILFVTVAMALVGVIATAGPAAAATGYAYNQCNFGSGDSVPYGVIHAHDGSYVRGNYDSVLPTLACTRGYLNWTDGTAGYYIAAGWCAGEYDEGVHWIRTIPGPVQRWWGTVSQTKTYYVKQFQGC